ncbi:MAG: transposase [Anaerolineales bacterium]|nr:transposase [Anaerolineales bacterium]
MAVSTSTLLRTLHQLEAPAIETPRIIGIDDWAFRKGRNYGTIIIDHETGKPIDLLPERDCETVKQWLEQQPSIEVVTRDRSGEYREAITQALPDAIQIADRWHLLKNLRETVERHLSRRYKAVRQLVTKGSVLADSQLGETSISSTCRRYAPGPTRELLHQARTEKREALFAAVQQRYAQEYSNVFWRKEL